jgi:hypothetical protein
VTTVAKQRRAKPAAPRRYYVAYGSNLCVRDMRLRCQGARPVGRLLLDNARLVFRGVADVVPEPGCATPAGLWLVTPEDEAALDRYEGNGLAYEKLELELEGGLPAFIYVMKNARGIAPPTEYYLGVLRRGYRDFGLDQAYLDDALNHSHDEKAHCPATRARYARWREGGHARRVGGRLVVSKFRIARPTAAPDDV